MKLSRSLGMLLLAIWLILTGLLPLLRVSFAGSGIVLAILAIAAGVLILIQDRLFRSPAKSLGLLLLSIWLILNGLFSLLSLSFAGRDVIMAVLAIAAGILLLLGR